MSIVEKKKKVFGNIAAIKTLTQGMPKLNLSSSFSSINNSGDAITFLTDLIKSLIGFEALVEAVVDIITHSLPKVEREVKKALKLELKTIVSCGVDPSLPSWVKSTAMASTTNNLVIELKKVDFANILRTDPNSVAGKLIYNDITTPLSASTDFNTFLYGVIQDEGRVYTWKDILSIRFDAVGTINRPNNSLTISAALPYDTKTLTDLNNDFIDSLVLFNSENIINKIMDIIYGSVSSFIGKSLKQLENEVKINDIVDKMVNNVNVGSLPDSAFSFTKEETYKQQNTAADLKKGVTELKNSTTIPSSVPIGDLTNFTQNILAVQTTIEKKDVIKTGLNNMATSSVGNVSDETDKNSGKLNFIQRIIETLIKSVVNIVLSPKVIMVFILNYKIVYGPSATFTDGVDFIKKNKNLMTRIMKVIGGEIIKVLLAIALKEISALVAKAMARKQKEKAVLKLAQLQSLVGIPADTIKNLIDNLL